MSEGDQHQHLHSLSIDEQLPINWSSSNLSLAPISLTTSNVSKYLSKCKHVIIP